MRILLDIAAASASVKLRFWVKEEAIFSTKKCWSSVVSIVARDFCTLARMSSPAGLVEFSSETGLQIDCGVKPCGNGTDNSSGWVGCG